jgi:hypothetical protein
MILRDLFKKPVISEGGNLASHTASGEPTVGYTGVPGTYSAGKIDSSNRAAMQPAVKQLLVDINNLFTRQYGRPIWSPELVEKEVETFISGSSKWFMQLRQPNPNFNPQQPPSDVNPKEIGVADKDFQRVKKKVGDIDTQIDRRLEPQIEEFLHKNIGANIGSATLLGTKKGSDQWLALWQLHEPPITLQVDLEFSDYTTDARGFEVPTEWAQVSHGSAWEDLELGMKGVFRQWLYRSLAKVAPTEKYIARMAGAGKNKGIKLFGGDDGKELVADIDNPPPPLHDANFSFAVASVGGGGVRAKYRQPTAEENVPLEINGIPVMVPLTTAESEYIKDMGSQFEQFFGVPAKANETKMMASLVGTVELMKQFFTPEQQQVAVQEFLKINFGKGAQMIDADDPTSDFKTKMTAIDYVLDQTGMQNLRKQAIQMAKDYENAFNAKKQPQPLAEAEVKAQLRKGMPHLHDLKSSDFLDLLDEIHDGNGNFKLQNIPLNVKVDGFGGRFGKNAEGKPFMGTSRTEPRYQAGFVAYHKQKGTTDPEILGRAQLFDQLFNEMMNAIQLVDGKLGPDFLVNKQVTCEVLYLPFATETPEGKLKFVGIHYDKLPDGVHLALVPFRVVDATTGEDLPDSNKFIKDLLKVGSSGSVMFIDNSLTQNEGLDVTALVPPLENIEQMKAMLASKKRDQAAEVKAALEPVKLALEKAIIEDPNIIGKDLLGQDYEGIVINSRLGPIKVTSQEQRDVITAKNAAVAAGKEKTKELGQVDKTPRTAVVATGNFAGHRGHEQLIDLTIAKAKELGGTPFVFVGKKVGPDDPIDLATKMETLHKLYPGVDIRLVENQTDKDTGVVTQGSDLKKVEVELVKEPPYYNNILIAVGTDQGPSMRARTEKLTRRFLAYPPLAHVKVGAYVTDREADKGGTGVSTTELRDALKNLPEEEAFKVWSRAYNVKKLGIDWIKHLMDIARGNMGIQQPVQQKPVQQPVQQQQPAPVAEQRLLNALIRPEKTESRLDEFDLFKKSAPMKTPAKKPGASSAEMRKFFQNQANRDKPGLKPKSVDMDNPQKVYVKYAEEEMENGSDVMSRMAQDLTGPGAPAAKLRAQRDQQRQKDRAQSDGRDHGPKWDVEEGSEIQIPTEDGITMQDIRLMAGEGPLTKKTILQAIAVIRKQRRPTGVEEGEQDPQSELKLINQKLKDAYKHIRNNSSVSIGWYMSEVKALNARREELIKQLKQGVAEGETSTPAIYVKGGGKYPGMTMAPRGWTRITDIKDEGDSYFVMVGNDGDGYKILKDKVSPHEIKLKNGMPITAKQAFMMFNGWTPDGEQGVAEAPKSAAVRLGNAIQRTQGKTAASQARSVIPSSIPKPEPKRDEKKVSEKLKTGPAAHFTPKDAHVKRGQFVGGEGVNEDIEKIMATLINKIVVNEAIQNNNR